MRNHFLASSLEALSRNNWDRQHIQGREAIFFERYTELPAFVQFNSNDCCEILH